MIAAMVLRGGWPGGGPDPLPIQKPYPMIPAGQAAREMVG
jgi:hypothetical protein